MTLVLALLHYLMGDRFPMAVERKFSKHAISFSDCALEGIKPSSDYKANHSQRKVGPTWCYALQCTTAK